MDTSTSSINNESDASMISNEEKKIIRKKKVKDKEKDKDTISVDGKENDKDAENLKNNFYKKKMSKIIMEDSDEENISVKKNFTISNGKDKDTNMS